MLSAEFYRITQSFAEDCGKVHKTLVDELNESAEAGLGLKPTYKFGRAGFLMHREEIQEVCNQDYSAQVIW